MGESYVFVDPNTKSLKHDLCTLCFFLVFALCRNLVRILRNFLVVKSLLFKTIYRNYLLM